MAHKTSRDTRKRAKLDDQAIDFGRGGDTHQTAGEDLEPLTTQQGVPIADDQNSLRIGARGPTALEDFHFREKIFHFDHERIPERVVHARGYGAHGFFENYESLADLTSADLFQRAGEKTPLFVRFSTVAGNKGSADLARDVRGFAVKLYTSRATGTSSEITSRCFSSRMRSSFRISFMPRNRNRIVAFRRRKPRMIISGTSFR